MADVQSLKIILGVANVGDKKRDGMVKYDTPEEVEEFLNTFYQRGGRALDTARNYSPHAPGSSEPRLGAVNAGARFSIDTKIAGAPGHGSFHNGAKIQESVDGSIRDLQLPEGAKVDVIYLHMPDRETPFEETIEALDKAHRQGKFQRLGLSNFTADEVEKIVNISKEKGYIAPSVYQGQYNPIVRSGEQELFPVLRKHDIAFYAWSPAAAGVFAGNQKQARSGGRFDPDLRLGQIYASFYSKSSVADAVDEAITVAAKYGISGHAAALRWTLHHSLLDPEKGDAVIIGASSSAQLSSNLDTVDAGSLPEEVKSAVEAVFEKLKDEDKAAYHF